MPDTITTRQAQGTWVVRAGGAILGETKAAVELLEPGRDPVIYFPRGDVAMAFLDKAGPAPGNPGIGAATHYAIVTKSRTIANAGWSYEAPKAGFGQIAGHIAFDPAKATVEAL